MKKLAVTLSLLAIAAGAFAQGSVNPNNGTTSQFRTNSVGLGGTAGLALSANGPFYYEVLTAPSTVTAVDASLQALVQAGSIWSDTQLTTSNTTFAGRMGTTATTVNNWGIGVAQSFIIVGWSASEGTTWSQVAGRLGGATLNNGVWSGGGLTTGWLGATAVSWRQAGGVTTSGTIATPLLFSGAGADAQGVPLNGLTDMFVINVPEPTTFALVGLGGAALMIFRRRKA
jgi:hypothetical protein